MRCWTPADVDGLMKAVAESLDHLRPWMPWAADEPLSRDRRLELIDEWFAAWDSGGDVIYGIFLRAVPGSKVEGAVVGGTGMHRRVGPGGLEIGYWIHVDHLRRGYAIEAAWAMTDAAFGDPNIDRVEIHHDEANRVSARVPFRLGYVDRGSHPEPPVAPGEIGRSRVWQTTRATWCGR